MTGTVLGFVIGGALLLAIGTSTAALWVSLPIAGFVAAYAPGTAPFAIGQAAFTITVAVLFNLLVPVGWTVGVVRVEDVAIGCGVSVVVGSLFWPRGIAGVVGDDLADAFRVGASYLSQTVEWVCGLRADPPDLAIHAIDAGLRLDESLRGLVTEQGTKHILRDELWRLVGGTIRLRLTAHAVAGLPRSHGAELAASQVISSGAPRPWTTGSTSSRPKSDAREDSRSPRSWRRRSTVTTSSSRCSRIRRSGCASTSTT